MNTNKLVLFSVVVYKSYESAHVTRSVMRIYLTVALATYTHVSAGILIIYSTPFGGFRPPPAAPRPAPRGRG